MKFKLTILSISLITVMSGAAIAPALGDIARYFEDANPTLIKLVLTLPAAFIVITSAFAGLIAKLASKRVLLFISLILYLIGGIGAGLSTNLTAMFILRALLGVGVGIMMPISLALVAEQYRGDARVRLMGLVNSSINVGGIVSLIISGLLSALWWRYSFGIYAMGFLVFIMVYLFIPRDDGHELEEETGSSFNTDVLLATMAAFGLMSSLYSVPTTLAMHLKQSGLGGSALAGIVIASLNIAGLLSSVLLKNLKNTLGRLFPLVLMSALSLGFWLLATQVNLIWITVGIVIAGFALGALIPSTFLYATRRAGTSGVTAMTGPVSSGLYLGQFASPLLTWGLSFLIPWSGANRTFTSVAVGVTIATLAILIFKNILNPDLWEKAENRS